MRRVLPSRWRWPRRRRSRSAGWREPAFIRWAAAILAAADSFMDDRDSTAAACSTTAVSRGRIRILGRGHNHNRIRRGRVQGRSLIRPGLGRDRSLIRPGLGRDRSLIRLGPDPDPDRGHSLVRVRIRPGRRLRLHPRRHIGVAAGTSIRWLPP
ncbi:hypothetical protein PT2222_380003 [Paraburkholderia tropica]